MVGLQTNLLFIFSNILSWYVCFGCDRYSLQEEVTIHTDKCLYRNFVHRDASLLCLEECHALPQVRQAHTEDKTIYSRLFYFVCSVTKHTKTCCVDLEKQVAFKWNERTCCLSFKSKNLVLSLVNVQFLCLGCSG